MNFAMRFPDEDNPPWGRVTGKGGEQRKEFVNQTGGTSNRPSAGGCALDAPFSNTVVMLFCAFAGLLVVSLAGLLLGQLADQRLISLVGVWSLGLAAAAAYLWLDCAEREQRKR